MNTKVLQDLYDRIDTSEDNIDTIKKDFDSYNVKHKQAIQLIDAKQVKIVDLMSRLEQDMKGTIDEKIQVIEQNFATQQQDISNNKMQIQDLKNNLINVMNDVDKKVITQQKV